MNIVTNYRILISTGCLIWIISIISEQSLGQPYSTVGCVIAPILTFIGLALWLKNYHTVRGHYPKLWKILKNNFSYGSINLNYFLSHMFEFWTFCILLWMGLSLSIFLTFSNSNAFNATKEYCKSNPGIISKTGEIKYFGIMVTGSLTTKAGDENAELLFTIVGEKGNFKVLSKQYKLDGTWIFEKLEIL